MSRSTENRAKVLARKEMTRDGDPLGPLDMTDAEYAVWVRFNFNAKSLVAEVARLEAQVAAVRRVRAYWDVRYYSDYAYALPFCGDIDRALTDPKASGA